MNDPARILVCWTPAGGRYPMAVGQLLLRDAAPRYEFDYLKAAERAARKGFRPFPEFPDLRRPYVSHELFPLFVNRLMTESRPDFDDYREQHSLDKGESDPDHLLRRTEGSRATDRIELIDWPKHGRPLETFVHFFVRGVAKTPGAEETIRQLQPGMPIEACDMPPDCDVIPLETPSGAAVGYLPWELSRKVVDEPGLGPAFRILVVKVNAPPAPIARRMLCRLEILRNVRWSEDYEPLACSEAEASAVHERPPEE
jgi:hypothetical protein